MNFRLYSLISLTVFTALLFRSTENIRCYINESYNLIAVKKYLLTLISCVCISSVYAQSQWTWMGGESNYLGVSYGTKGVADPTNRPGVRSGAASWRDMSGDLWMFGGDAYNDLWKYNGSTKLWTWVGGDSDPNQKAVYGIRGTASPGNRPGASSNVVSWQDAAGNFWMYSDVLWKYSPYVNQWTWVNGDTAVTKAVYGVKGIADAANKPAPVNSFEWTDASGNFWLYGNVLWKYDPAADLWTWVHGDTLNTTTVYGSKGVPGSSNTPGTRARVTGWSDASGKLWLFGGYGTVSTPYMISLGRYYYVGDLNDLWNYDPQTNQWTWISGDTLMYAAGAQGTLGTAAPLNRPGARSDAVSWTDNLGNLWLFGGYQYTPLSQPYYHPYNDLWKYDPLANLWTCFNNSSFFLSGDIFDVKGMESPKTRPATRYGAAGWKDASGNLWLFGGITYDQETPMTPYRMNDLLKYNPAMNMWSLEYENNYYGRQYGNNGSQGVAGASNIPGGRFDATARTDSAGNLWLFGGFGYHTRIYFDDLNDLWKRDTANKWAWISGSNSVEYDPRNTFATVPAVRTNAITWMDTNNKLWLFGGTLIYGDYFNDLWNFDNITGKWTKKSSNSVGSYGIKGQPADANKPNGRDNPVNWTGKEGRLWMFGGGAARFPGPYSEFNDVWNFDPATNQWTWVSGDSTAGQPGVYGSKGIPDPGNKPAARQGAVAWSDNSDNVWIFGGFNSANGGKVLNDLWKYNTLTNVWTWVSGDSTVNQKGVYGTKGLPDAANKPGARYEAVNWVDATGKLWLFGGAQVGTSSYGGLLDQRYFLNDLCMYDPVTNLWTWVSGDSTINTGGLYGSIGVPGNSNKPGSRAGAVAWKDKSGDLWLMGGTGYGWKGDGFLNDVWKFSPASFSTLPVSYLGFLASLQNSKVILNWSTADEQHCAYYAVQRSRDGISYDSIGTVTAKNGNLHDVNNYEFTDDDPYQEVNYYRLKQVDIDGRYTYSTVKKVVMELAAFSYTLLQNPVTSEIRISLQSDKFIKAQAGVRDAAGQLVAIQPLQISRGRSTFSIPVKGLSAGMYFLTITSGKTSTTKKFIKH